MVAILRYGFSNIDVSMFHLLSHSWITPKSNNLTFETSKPHYILSITITCVLCVLDLITLRYNNFIKIDFETAITSFHVYCYNILFAFLIIVTLVMSNPRMRLLQTIMEVSSRLSPKFYQKLSILIHTKDIFGSFCIIGLIFTCFYHMSFDIICKIFIMYATH